MTLNYLAHIAKTNMFLCKKRPASNAPALRPLSQNVTIACMSYECKNLNGTFCEKRQKECDPGEPGCVLRGRVSFPLKEKVDRRSAPSEYRKQK